MRKDESKKLEIYIKKIVEKRELESHTESTNVRKHSGGVRGR